MKKEIWNSWDNCWKPHTAWTPNRIAATLALSTPECTRIQDKIRLVTEKKAEKEEEKWKMEEEQAALKETLEKVSEAEEREQFVSKKIRDRE